MGEKKEGGNRKKEEGRGGRGRIICLVRRVQYIVIHPPVTIPVDTLV